MCVKRVNGVCQAGQWCVSSGSMMCVKRVNDVCQAGQWCVSSGSMVCVKRVNDVCQAGQWCVNRVNSDRHCFNENLVPRLLINHEFVCVYMEEESQLE